MDRKFIFLVFVFVLVLIGGFFLLRGNQGITGETIEAPSDFIKEEDVFLYEDKVVINISNASISGYSSSKSMMPFLDEGANGIKKSPESPEEIDEGDIVTFNREELIAHRVIEKGKDEKGYYFITKGDNSDSVDGKIRFSDIESVLVGIVY